MAGKKFGGDKIKREKMKQRNPRGDKKGGRKPQERGKNSHIVTLLVKDNFKKHGKVSNRVARRKDGKDGK